MSEHQIHQYTKLRRPTKKLRVVVIEPPDLILPLTDGRIATVGITIRVIDPNENSTY